VSDRLKGKICIITGTGSGMGRVGVAKIGLSAGVGQRPMR
jgi:hypothetical protein